MTGRAINPTAETERFQVLDLLRGFALCGMASAEDLRHRFYSTDESRQTIARDVATFADTHPVASDKCDVKSGVCVNSHPIPLWVSPP